MALELPSSGAQPGEGRSSGRPAASGDAARTNRSARQAQGSARQTRLHAGISGIAREDWQRGRPGDAEGWDYLVTCETGTPAAFSLSAISLADGRGFLGGFPLFTVGYRLDTPFQEEDEAPPGGTLAERAGRLARSGARALLRGLEWRLLAIGSPFTENCPVALLPSLPPEERDAVLAELLGGVEAEARRQKAGLVAVKDIDPQDMQRIGPALKAAGYVPLESLPHAVLDLAGTSTVDDWLARLSSATRKDLRRKLKRADRVSVEWRQSIVGLEEEVRALYDATRAQSHVRYGDFEDLPDGYFERVAAAQPDQVLFAFYRVGDRLAAFNFLLVEADRVIDKFLGMSYPLARDHDLYAVSWAENVRLCQRLGKRFLQTGQTAFASKLRYGSGLRPSTIMVKHLNPVLHALVRLAVPWLGFPRWDPDLVAHRKRENAR
ncbi:GNAT family N-acetyltransferase [Ancylobacter oerskovii]|uniref:GNAT family N-acetyltransferase n=1 Tax=Ancylobacter oerskovii TaxID=459519 RepID=A0ABW4YZ09_9HYPH|nr:GNAT family N-acetyltransferase [Ancylobacter oerskovii]MBS7543936.1 GNAT family N-acetyltransferase [Ancylobacter oerskovii]